MDWHDPSAPKQDVVGALKAPQWEGEQGLLTIKTSKPISPPGWTVGVTVRPKFNCSFDLEDLMNDRMFDSPVFVKSRNSLIQEIACLENALEFLYEWPESKRGIIYETALRACRRAFDSGYPLSAAREAFCGFAKSVNIHEEVTTTLPWMVGNRTRGGGEAA